MKSPLDIFVAVTLSAFVALYVWLATYAIGLHHVVQTLLVLVSAVLATYVLTRAAVEGR